MSNNLTLDDARSLVATDIRKWVIESLVIENDEQMQNISDVILRGKKLTKEATAARMADTKPLKDEAKAIEAEWNPIILELETRTKIAEKAVFTYRNKKQAEIEAAQIERMKQQAAAVAEAQQTGELVPKTEAVEDMGSKVRANLGTLSFKKVAVYTVVNEKLVERSLCSPDLKKIQARHESGVESIPGVLIEWEDRTVGRGG